MADVHDPSARSRNMRAIRSHDTAIENRLAKILEELGLSFRMQVKELPGKPDFVIDSYKKIIFTHGCFWHYHQCHLFKVPATRTEFWMEKIRKNSLRDEVIREKLIAAGWQVMVIWECALMGKFRLPINSLSERVEEWICAGCRSVEIDTKGIHERNV